MDSVIASHRLIPSDLPSSYQNESEVLEQTPLAALVSC